MLISQLTTLMDANYQHHHHHLNANNMSDNTTFTSVESHESSYYTEQSSFEASEFFDVDDWIADNPTFMTPSGYSQHQDFAQDEAAFNPFGSCSYHEGSSSREIRSTKEKGIKHRVAFRTMSPSEILDDGFKWRKYGKKMVKNSPNPRNYYKCSAEGCPVKKRVERDKEDERYVITTYEGIHDHPGPSQI